MCVVEVENFDVMKDDLERVNEIVRRWRCFEAEESASKVIVIVDERNFICGEAISSMKSTPAMNSMRESLVELLV
jgi:hypothetical protein